MSVDVKGKIVQVIGTVVDIRFPSDNLPPIYGAVYLTNPTISDKPDNLVLEVAQHVGDSTVRCIAMETTDGLQRSQEATYKGAQISIPVGNEILGRVLNVIGDPVDGVALLYQRTNDVPDPQACPDPCGAEYEGRTP